MLAALPPDTNSFYRHTQIGIFDIAYSALLATSLFLIIGLLASRWLRWDGWVLALIAIPDAIFDYIENTNIRFIWFLEPDNFNEAIIDRASDRSTAKALFSSLAMSVLLVLLLAWLFFWLRESPQHQACIGAQRRSSELAPAHRQLFQAMEMVDVIIARGFSQP
ncbi:MAG: hypothetical protein MO846_08660 [Candidatus Devosia symbiotica]|nr:hypothetical protein [Candidatus Devosia symbiotica]